MRFYALRHNFTYLTQCVTRRFVVDYNIFIPKTKIANSIEYCYTLLH